MQSTVVEGGPTFRLLRKYRQQHLVASGGANLDDPRCELKMDHSRGSEVVLPVCCHGERDVKKALEVKFAGSLEHQS